jgi:hypothetical protein
MNERAMNMNNLAEQFKEEVLTCVYAPDIKYCVFQSKFTHEYSNMCVLQTLYSNWHLENLNDFTILCQSLI